MNPDSAAVAPAFSIGQIALTVSDLPRAVAFYRDILGFSFLFEAPNMAFFDCGGVRLMLSISETPDSTYNSIIYYRTANIHETCDQLRARGVVFEAPARMIARMPDHELWMAFFRDSESNLAAFMSEIRESALPL